MKELKDKIKKFRDDRDWGQFHTPENIAKSISIEAAELLECFQWNNNYDLNQVSEEIADVMNYCILMCIQLELEPTQIILDKIKKNEAKYPIDQCKGNSKKYTQLGD